MIRNKICSLYVFLLMAVFISCRLSNDVKQAVWEDYSRIIQVGNWQYELNVEYQNKKYQLDTIIKEQYLKVTLRLSNHKRRKSLLYSVVKNKEDYEKMYQYLSFGAIDDLFLKFRDLYVHPMGYVFEPSNELSLGDRLVYKFQIDDNLFQELSLSADEVEFWFIDRLAGSGKICFKKR